MTADVAGEIKLRRGRLSPLRPEGYVTAFLLAILTTAGIYYVNIMAAIVTGLSDGLGFSAKEAGLVGSANVYGAAAGALVAVFLVKRLPWRKLMWGLLSLLVALDLVSILVTTPELMIGLRFVHGVVGGCSVGVGLAVMARTPVPDRAFGMLLVVQYGFGGLGVMFLPGLVPEFGARVLFFALAAFTGVALASLPFLPPFPPKAVVPGEAVAAPPAIKRLPLILTLAGLFIFQAANMATAAYIIELGREFGLTQKVISPILGVSNWVGILGAALVIVLAGRLGRLWPLMLVLFVTLVGTWIYHWSDLVLVYLIASMVTSVTWSFVVPYFFGMSAEFDAAGQMTALAGFFSKLGLASGPAVAAFIVGGEDGGGVERYRLLIDLALVGIALSAVAVLWPAMLSDRTKRAARLDEAPAAAAAKP